MKTILRTVYILAAAAVVFGGLFWYAATRGTPETTGLPVSGETRAAAEKPASQQKNPASGTEAENVRVGRSGEHISGDAGVLIMVRNLVWTAGGIILVLLLQAGWRKLARRKSKVNAGSA